MEKIYIHLYMADTPLARSLREYLSGHPDVVLIADDDYDHVFNAHIVIYDGKQHMSVWSPLVGTYIYAPQDPSDSRYVPHYAKVIKDPEPLDKILALLPEIPELA